MTNSSKIPYVNSQKFELPQEVLEPSSVSLPPKLPPIVPAPKNLPTLKTFSEISNQPRAEGGRGNNPLSFIPNPLPKQVTEPTPRPTPSSVPTAIPKQPAPESQPVIIPPIESVQDRPFGRVNFQDILRNNNQEPLLRQGFGGQARTKNQGDEDATGLRWEEEREQISNNPSFAKASEGKQFQISNASPPPSLPPQGGGMGAGGKQVIQQKEQDKAGDIDRKLEELGKRIK